MRGAQARLRLRLFFAHEQRLPGKNDLSVKEDELLRAHTASRRNGRRRVARCRRQKRKLAFGQKEKLPLLRRPGEAVQTDERKLRYPDGAADRGEAVATLNLIHAERVLVFFQREHSIL